MQRFSTEDEIKLSQTISLMKMIQIASSGKGKQMKCKELTNNEIQTKKEIREQHLTKNKVINTQNRNIQEKIIDTQEI